MSEAAGTSGHVLIETRNPDRAAEQARALEAAGFTTSRCEGPAHETRDCPVLWGKDCDLVTGADAVLHDLDLRHPVDHEVLEGLKMRYPNLPVVVEASAGTARELRRDLDRCTVVVPYSMEHLADAIAEALAEA